MYSSRSRSLFALKIIYRLSQFCGYYYRNYGSLQLRFFSLCKKTFNLFYLSLLPGFSAALFFSGKTSFHVCFQLIFLFLSFLTPTTSSWQEFLFRLSLLRLNFTFRGGILRACCRTNSSRTVVFLPHSTQWMGDQNCTSLST